MWWHWKEKTFCLYVTMKFYKPSLTETSINSVYTVCRMYLAETSDLSNSERLLDDPTAQ